MTMMMMIMTMMMMIMTMMIFNDFYNKWIGWSRSVFHLACSKTVKNQYSLEFWLYVDPYITLLAHAQFKHHYHTDVQWQIMQPMHMFSTNTRRNIYDDESLNIWISIHAVVISSRDLLREHIPLKIILTHVTKVAIIFQCIVFTPRLLGIH